MDYTILIMWIGFTLASYSVVGNDVIQTLGTFLSSNEERPWWILWFFAASILSATLIYSWFSYDGDVSYLRLVGDPPQYSIDNPKYPLPDPFHWYYTLPPLVLLFVTKWGVPVSTSFFILTFFQSKHLGSMLLKSVSGYFVAFGSAVVVYLLIAKILEENFQKNKIKKNEIKYWSVLQWVSTGFLWTQWLSQDFANIYVYLPRQLELSHLVLSLFILLALLAFIFHSRGGAIQQIVKSKSNTTDIRSATIIDFIYGIILYYFKELNSVPMSTTWVFLGLLAGRELAINLRLHKKITNSVVKDITKDLAKLILGLGVSIGLVLLIQLISGDVNI